MKRIAAAAPLLASLTLAMQAHAQSLPAAQFEPFTVSDIRVDGLQRISAGTVFTYMPLERGDVVDHASAARAIRALFRTGFFNDVRLDRQDNILVVTVRERPAINKITLVGNKDIKTEELNKNLKEIGLAEGETFDRLQLERVVQELTRAYNNRGKYNVSVQPSVTPLDRNRVDVQIDIKEARPRASATSTSSATTPSNRKICARGGKATPPTGNPGTSATTSIRARSFPATWKSSTPTTSTAAMSISTSNPPRCRSAPTGATCTCRPT